MKPVRILIYDVPGVLIGMVRGLLLSDPVCEIVERMADSGSLESNVAKDAPDMVIVVNEAHNNAPSRFAPLLLSKPSMRVLAITPHRGRAFVHWLKPHVMEIGELSSANMMSAVQQTRDGLGAEA